MAGVLIGAIFLGCVAALAVELSRGVCARITPFADGPEPSEPPTIVLIAASALLGGVLAYVSPSPIALLPAGIAVFALVACWCSDALCGILPDIFTLAPLALVLAAGLLRRDWWTIVSAFALFVPFAVAAAATQGKGMGWGDTKLAALAGAVLGGPLGFVAMAVACVAAAVGYKVKHITAGPIALAPYIASTVALALPLAFAR
jgi:prepilin signal peptidase PulO-like enzyme (type II secretory pathway)